MGKYTMFIYLFIYPLIVGCVVASVTLVVFIVGAAFNLMAPAPASDLIPFFVAGFVGMFVGDAIKLHAIHNRKDA